LASLLCHVDTGFVGGDLGATGSVAYSFCLLEEVSVVFWLGSSEGTREKEIDLLLFQRGGDGKKGFWQDRMTGKVVRVFGIEMDSNECECENEMNTKL